MVDKNEILPTRFVKNHGVKPLRMIEEGQKHADLGCGIVRAARVSTHTSRRSRSCEKHDGIAKELNIGTERLSLLLRQSGFCRVKRKPIMVSRMISSTACDGDTHFLSNFDRSMRNFSPMDMIQEVEQSGAGLSSHYGCLRPFMTYCSAKFKFYNCLATLFDNNKDKEGFS